MANDQIEAIERDMAKAKPAIDFANALTRLKGNADFKTVVLKGYFEAEAIRLVHLKAEPHMQRPESQASVLSQIDAIGQFSGFLNAALAKAVMAQTTLDDGEAALVEIHEQNKDE